MELMKGLAEIARRYELPIQTHVAESKPDTDWVRRSLTPVVGIKSSHSSFIYALATKVRELHPDQPTYTHVYQEAGLLTDKTILAHAVRSCILRQST